MARFIGTIEEYEKFIGPRIRNKVNTLTIKERKKREGICEFCKKNTELQSAHKRGKERKTLIFEVLKKYDKGIYFDVDLIKCENEIVNLHKPVEQVFFFLCPDCHRKYDNNENSDIKPVRKNEGNVENEQLQGTSSSDSNRPLLLLLPDEDTFKKNLLIYKKVHWTISYYDGNEDNGIWNANNFKESSNVRSNIWSGYLRGWKSKRILKAIFEVKVI